jgi:hypothetical protein
MDNRITKLALDPFYAASANGLSLFVDARTGDIVMGSAGLRAWKGLVFSLKPEQTGHLLRLQYRDITIDVGWTEDAADAASWVEAVNAFLATKKDAAPPNGRVTPQTPAESAIG